MRFLKTLVVLLFTFSLYASTDFATHIHYSDKGLNTIGYIYIGDHSKSISQGTWVYVKNALDYYKKNRPIFIVLELDTPGGEIFAAQKISDALKEMDIQEGIPVVTFINNWAISAGAMLAYSTRYITIVKDASMGAAEPITSSGEKTSEKVHSAIRADFANRAAFFDRNPLIAEAMVDADIVLVMREGKIVQLMSDEKILPTDKVITRKGKLLTLNSKEMMEYGVADALLLPEKIDPITDFEKSEGKYPASKLLLFKQSFFKDIPQATIVAYQKDWKMNFLMFLTNPVVTSFLVLVLMIAIYAELHSGGFGVAAMAGIIALFLLILSSFAIEAAGMLEVIILIVGIVLILLEIFVTPTFGALGIVGIILTLFGLGALLLPGLKEFHFDFDTQTFNAAALYVFERLAWIASAVVVGILLIAFFGRNLASKWQKISPLVLRGEQESALGYHAGEVKALTIGAQGIVMAPLRPAGKVEINGEVYDALSSGRFLEKGASVKVIEKQGSRIVVEEIRK